MTAAQVDPCGPLPKNATAKVFGPDNLLRQSELLEVSFSSDIPTARVRFDGRDPGWYYVEVVFDTGPVAHGDLLLVRVRDGGQPEAVAGVPHCTILEPTQNGWLCFERDWTWSNGSTAFPVGTTGGLAAAAGKYVWFYGRLQPPSAEQLFRFVETDAGLVQDGLPSPIEPSAPPAKGLMATETDVIISGGPQSDHFSLSNGAISMTDGGTTPSPTGATYFLRIGSSFTFNTLRDRADARIGGSRLCRVEVRNAAASPFCVDLDGRAVGLTAAGGWTWDERVLRLFSLSTLTLVQQLELASYRVWPSGTIPGGAAVGVGGPLIGLKAPRMKTTPLGIPIVTDAGIVIERIPELDGYSLFGATDAVIWWSSLTGVRAERR